MERWFKNGEMISHITGIFKKMERWFKIGEIISHIAGIFKKWRDGSKMER